MLAFSKVKNEIENISSAIPQDNFLQKVHVRVELDGHSSTNPLSAGYPHHYVLKTDLLLLLIGFALNV